MSLDKIQRTPLVRTWQARAEELKAQGQSPSQIERFLSRLDTIPGHDVGDICLHWSRQQQEQRPVWDLLMQLSLVLATALSYMIWGPVVSLLTLLTVGLLALVHREALYHRENRFADEVLARAQSVPWSLPSAR